MTDVPKPPSRAAKVRLDVLLVERGFFESREKAQRAIMAGNVLVGLNGGAAGEADRVIDKPGTRVAADAPIRVKNTCRYVGRGGLKLEAALREFGIDPGGRVALDIGASTGGFTDCLLQHGARQVHAVDVGHSQLDWKIRSDERVVVYEKMNARHMTPGDLVGLRRDAENLESLETPDSISLPTLCVIDVSFISLTLILPAVFGLLAPEGEVVALIKPQFELGKAEVDAGRGVVRDPAAHQRAVEKIRAFVDGLANPADATPPHAAVEWRGLIASPILGGDGNREFLVHLRKKSATNAGSACTPT